METSQKSLVQHPQPQHSPGPTASISPSLCIAIGSFGEVIPARGSATQECANQELF